MVKLEIFQAHQICQCTEYVSTLHLTVIFSDKKAYLKNAESPESNVQDDKVKEYFEYEPECHDGQAIFIRRLN